MQQWFIALCGVVFLLSCANTYIQAKRRAFILTCLGLTGILFCLSFLIAAILLPGDKAINDLSKGELIICHITGIIFAIQSMALFSIVFALSIDLYVTFRIKSRAIRDSYILKSIIVFFCCFQPTLCILLNIAIMLIENIQIVDIIGNGGWCNVKFDGNRWGVLFIRALPFWLISIPGAFLACAAIIPSLILAIKAQRKHRESPSQSETNPTMSSRNQISREVSSDTVVRSTQPASSITESLPSDLPSTAQSSNKITNEALTRMALYCILYTAVVVPYCIYSLVKFLKFFNYWHIVPIDLSEITFCNYLSVGIGMGTLIVIFFIFATNDSSIKQYKEAWVWWKYNCFFPIFDFVTGQKHSIHVNIVRNVASNSEKEPRESISVSIGTIITEGNVNSSNDPLGELPATVSSRGSIISKSKKRWSIFTDSRENLTEAEKARKIRQSTEDTVTFENSSPTALLFNQNTNKNTTRHLSKSSSSSYSSTTAIMVDSSEPPSQQNNDLSNRSTVPILGGLSPAPRRTPPLSSPLRECIDDKDNETVSSSSIKRPSSPQQIRNSSILLRQSASAPTSPTSPNSTRDRFNPPRRFTSPLRKPSSPMMSSSTTFVGMQEFDDDEIEQPFPSLLKIGKTFNDEWRPASTSTFALRPINRMSSIGSYNSNVRRPNNQAISRSPTFPTTSGNPFRNNLPIVNDVNEVNESSNSKNKKG